jgi:hypothetical protein
LPPRRVSDVAMLELSRDFEDNTKNYIVVSKNLKPKYLVYNVYKTDKFHGQNKIKIPARLIKILHKYITGANLKLGDRLFGRAVNFSEVVSKVFNKGTDNKLSVNSLRKAFISNYLSKPRSITEKKELALLMGHNKEMQERYLRLEITV